MVSSCVIAATELVLIEGAAHGLALTHAEQFNRALSAFGASRALAPPGRQALDAFSSLAPAAGALLELAHACCEVRPDGRELASGRGCCRVGGAKLRRRRPLVFNRGPADEHAEARQRDGQDQTEREEEDDKPRALNRSHPHRLSQAPNTH